ncbi:MAG: hypothetical protein ACTJFN_13200 [Sphingobacterium sp.]
MQNLMENYTLIFKSPLKMLLDRRTIFELLARKFPEVGPCSIEMDDKQFFLNVPAPRRMENEIQRLLLDHGYNVAFVRAKAFSRNEAPNRTA